MMIIQAVFADAWRLLRARVWTNVAAMLVLALGLIAVVSIRALSTVVAHGASQAVPADEIYAIGVGGGSAQFLELQGEEAMVLRREVPELAGSVLYRSHGFDIASSRAHDGSRAERISGLQLDGDLFTALGWPTAIGRGFDADDFRAGAQPVLVIGDRLWHSRFNADPSVIGRVVRVDGEPATVIGVLPAQRAFPFQQQIYRAMSLQSSAEHQARRWQMLFRTDRATELEAVHAALAAQQAARERAAGDAARQAPLHAASLWTGTSSEETFALLFVLGAVVALVMLLAAVNAGGLVLVQWLGRGRELATRHALGASSSRVLAALIAQACSLALGAWLLALAASSWLIDYMNAYFWSTENGMPLYAEIRLSPDVLLISLAVSLGVALLLCVPTWRRLRRDGLAASLRSGARTAGGEVTRFGRAMFGLQSLLATVTVLAAMQAVVAARDQFDHPLGLDTDAVWVARFDTADPSAKKAFADRLRARLHDTPEVAAVSLSESLPLTMNLNREVRNGEGKLEVELAPVDPGFRDVYGFSMRRGRWLGEADVNEGRMVAVIDPALASALFGEGDPIGRTVSLDGIDGVRDYEVVGVSASVRLVSRGGADRPSLFIPVAEHPLGDIALALRLRSDPAGFNTRAYALAAEINPDIALSDAGSFAEMRRRVSAWTLMVLGMFAPLGGLALVLATSGLTALLGTLVSQRIREIGLRRALGAPSVSVAQTLIARLALWGGIGGALGVLIAFVLVGPLSTMLYGDNHVGALSITSTLAVLSISLLLASVAPVRRALRIDPMSALRDDG